MSTRKKRSPRRAAQRIDKPSPKPRKPSARCADAFQARKDGSLVIYVARPDGPEEHWWEGEPIRIEPERVSAVLAACGDALAKKPSVR